MARVIARVLRLEIIMSPRIWRSVDPVPDNSPFGDDGHNSDFVIGTGKDRLTGRTFDNERADTCVIQHVHPSRTGGANKGLLENSGYQKSRPCEFLPREAPLVSIQKIIGVMSLLQWKRTTERDLFTTASVGRNRGNVE